MKRILKLIQILTNFLFYKSNIKKIRKSKIELLQVGDFISVGIGYNAIFGYENVKIEQITNNSVITEIYAQDALFLDTYNFRRIYEGLYKYRYGEKVLVEFNKNYIKMNKQTYELYV